MGITVENISKSYNGKTALQRTSFELHDGNFTTLLGATGSGKTTLLRIMAGVENPDAGRILYDGKDMARVPVRDRPIAMVYQQFVNYPSLTVYENIASPLRVSREKPARAEIEKRVTEAADLLGIRDVLQHRPGEVSGGQQQRTAIARALVKRAKYIFLDEPLANLDFKLREELRGELKRLFRTSGGAVLYATPEPVDALSMATHVGMMSEGRLLQYGPAREVYTRPNSVGVGEYFSYPTMNIVEATLELRDDTPRIRISETLIAEAPSLSSVLKPGRYRVGFRAHALDVVRKQDSDLPLRATVELSEVVGSDTEVHALHQGNRLTVLTEQIHVFDIGEEIDLFLDARELFLFDPDTDTLVAKTTSRAEAI